MEAVKPALGYGATNSLKCEPYIRLSSGGCFNFAHPASSDYTIEDIAHALSRICRFTGHVNAEHYSVAQHSVLVSYLLDNGDALAGLMHDAAEAFINDISTPLKQLLPDYRRIEAEVEHEVLSRFGIFSLPPAVKLADRILLRTEQRDLMPDHGGMTPIWRDHNPAIQPLPGKIQPWYPDVAKKRFLRRFYDLTENA